MSEPPGHIAPSHALTAADWRAIIAQSSLLFEVISDSMRPTFAKGERVRIRPLEKDEPQFGQVVAFFHGAIVTHRYLGNGRFRGDNTLTVDRDIDPAAIIGIVSAVSRDGREVPIPPKGRLSMALNHLRLKRAKLADRLRAGAR